MPIELTAKEKMMEAKLSAIKKLSGSHSPSPAMISGAGIKIKYDFCYLSNPYATDLFLKYFNAEIKGERLAHLIEHYPSQNRSLAQKLTAIAGVPADNIFVGNGATEIIQAVLHNFAKKKILVPIPTFSPYLEFAPEGVAVITHQLQREDRFLLNTERFAQDVRERKPDTVVILDPNNPDGGSIGARGLHTLIQTLRHVETIIVDESFVHFAGRKVESAGRLVKKFPNLVVIKSFSKDFGVAGLRLGYGTMSGQRVSELLKRGYLWNVSGFGEYFLNLLTRKDFLKEYEHARLLAVRERDAFFARLSRIPGLQVYPSKASMFLVELLDGSSADELSVRLLVRHGIYIRPCGDKVGLRGEFVRVASRRSSENDLLVRALKESFS